MPENLVFEPRPGYEGTAWQVFKPVVTNTTKSENQYLGCITLLDGAYVFVPSRNRNAQRISRARRKIGGAIARFSVSKRSPVYYSADDLSAIALRISQLSLSGYDGTYGKESR